MSLLESIVWHVLGYSAIPLIVIAGIGIAILVFQLAVKLLGADEDG